MPAFCASLSEHGVQVHRLASERGDYRQLAAGPAVADARFHRFAEPATRWPCGRGARWGSPPRTAGLAPNPPTLAALATAGRRPGCGRGGRWRVPRLVGGAVCRAARRGDYDALARVPRWRWRACHSSRPRCTTRRALHRLPGRLVRPRRPLLSIRAARRDLRAAAAASAAAAAWSGAAAVVGDATTATVRSEGGSSSKPPRTSRATPSGARPAGSASRSPASPASTTPHLRSSAPRRG